MKIILLSIFVLMLRGSSLLQAQFVADTTLNTKVHDLTGSEQSVPLTCTTSGGRTYVSWFDNSSGQYDLRMQLLDSLGQKLWPDTGLLISNYPQSSGLYRYDLVSDAEGNAIVAFQDERSGSLQIVASKVNQQGSLLWGAAGIVLTDSVSTGLAPVLGVLSNNDVVVAWSASGTGSRWIPYCKLSAGSGSILWSGRIAAEGQRYSRPSLVASGNGNFIMLYVKEAGGFPPLSTMYAQKYSGENAQNLWAEATQVSSKNIPFFFFPQIQADTKEGFFLVFNTGNPVNPMLNDVYAQHVDSSGNIWTDEGIQISMGSDGNKYNGGYCWNPSDSSLCIAIRTQDGNQTMSGIALQKINSAGQRLLGENGLELRAMSADLYTPWLLLNSGDGLVCIYGAGGFNNQQIRGLKTDYSGEALWTYDPVASASASNKDDLSAGPFRNGQTVLVWADDRSGDLGIYAQNLRLSGRFGNGELTEIKTRNLPVPVRILSSPGKNPVLELSSSENAWLEYRVADVAGKKLRSGKAQMAKGKNQVFPVNELLPGLYLVEINCMGQRQLFRLVKD